MAVNWDHQERENDTHIFFYQYNHQKLELVNEIIVKASLDNVTCYIVNK